MGRTEKKSADEAEILIPDDLLPYPIWKTSLLYLIRFTEEGILNEERKLFFWNLFLTQVNTGDIYYETPTS